MAYSCDHCGKGVQIGRNIRHKRGVAGGRWKRKAQKTPRQWLPNLHWARVVEDKKVVRRRLCTKCLRRAERPKSTKSKEESGKIEPRTKRKEKKDTTKVEKSGKGRKKGK